jgi:short-subunit dehydrogenase
MTRLGPYRFAGRTAVLTGAASGIGEQLAYGLAERGSDLVLLDRDAPRLHAVTATIRSAHPDRSVDAFTVDLADRDATIAAAQQIRRDHPAVGLLINNAGVALGGTFEQITLDEFEWVMDINFRAPVILTHHLLPALTASPGGHLVNVSSLYGLVAPPGQSAYCSSKFALRGFSLALAAELGARGTGVTTVHPGGVRTRIAESARMGAGIPPEEAEQSLKLFAAVLSYPAEKAASEILDAVKRRRARVLITPSARIGDVLARVLPASNARLMQLLTTAAARGAVRKLARAQRALPRADQAALPRADQAALPLVDQGQTGVV